MMFTRASKVSPVYFSRALTEAERPVASWITAEWLDEMRALLPPSAYERVILNRWTSELGDFVSKEQWERCIDYGVPQQRGKLGYT